MPFTWGEFTADVLALPPFDFVLGSDIFYDSARTCSSAGMTVFFTRVARVGVHECVDVCQQHSSVDGMSVYGVP